MTTTIETRKKGAYLNFEERKKIEELRAGGASAEEIAYKLGVHFGTIYRELRRGATLDMHKNGIPVYNAEQAQQKAAASRANRGKKSGENDGRSKRRADPANMA